MTSKDLSAKQTRGRSRERRIETTDLMLTPNEAIEEMSSLYAEYLVAKKKKKFLLLDTKQKVHYFTHDYEQLIKQYPIAVEQLIFTQKYDANDFAQLVNNPPVENTLKTTEVKQRIEEQAVKSIDSIVLIATSMYNVLKELVKADIEAKKESRKEIFMPLSDKDKLEHFREKLSCGEFMTEYPIVSRYMIAHGQYSAKAFKRMLEKIARVVHPPPDKREKGYMEDQYVRRQADYVRYLWEAYQKGHYNTSEAQTVWDTTYKRLKGEFDDFRNKYKDIEENVKLEKKQLLASNAKDILNRLRTGTQTISNDADASLLLQNVKNITYKRRYLNCLKQLKQVRTELPASYETYGTSQVPEEVAPDKSKTITMIEHIDESRMHEVPEHMRLDEATARRLPGYLDSVAEEQYD